MTVRDVVETWARTQMQVLLVGAVFVSAIQWIIDRYVDAAAMNTREQSRFK